MLRGRFEQWPNKKHARKLYVNESELQKKLNINFLPEDNLLFLFVLDDVSPTSEKISCGVLTR